MSPAAASSQLRAPPTRPLHLTRCRSGAPSSCWKSGAASRAELPRLYGTSQAAREPQYCRSSVGDDTCQQPTRLGIKGGSTMTVNRRDVLLKGGATAAALATTAAAQPAAAQAMQW